MPRITPIHWKTLEKIFIKAGFEFKRQQGSHRSYTKQGITRPVIIPTYKEVQVDIIQSNLNTANMNREEYFKLLDECK